MREHCAELALPLMLSYRRTTIALLLLTCFDVANSSMNPDPEPVHDGPIQVYIMSGQSNMEGYGLGMTTCDRITSTTVCHNETHDPEQLGKCVFDDEDGECCFTQKYPGREGYRKEKCRYYNLDNYTLTALVESGNEEYQHFQNATGHWETRDDVKININGYSHPLQGKSTPLSVGFGIGNPYGGAHEDSVLFGPELEFGNVVGNHIKKQVLLIKYAVGG